jgi:hypothetical protein
MRGSHLSPIAEYGSFGWIDAWRSRLLLLHKLGMMVVKTSKFRHQGVSDR